jgi:hypothetical protein
MTQEPAHARLRETVQNYFDGLHRSSGESLRAAFHPDARITGFSSQTGELGEMSLDEFVAFAEKQPPASERGEPYDMTLVSADITGQVAMVKVEDLYLGKRFTDYLLLLDTDQGWRIHAKLWHAEPGEG